MSALGPLVLAYVLLFLAPFVMFARLSLYKTTGLGTYGHQLTLVNYRELLTTGSDLLLLWHTVELCLVTSVLCCLIGYSVGFYCAYSGRYGSAIFTLCIGLVFTNTVVRALGWVAVLSQDNWIVRLFSLGGSARLTGTFEGVVIATVSAGTPLLVLLIVPVLRAIPEELPQVAHSLGASELYTQWRITWPLSRYGVISGGLLVFASTAAAFTTPSLLGGGRVNVLSLVIQQDVTTYLDYPDAAAAGVVLLVIVALVVAGVSFVVGRRATARRLGVANSPAEVEPAAELSISVTPL